MRLASRFGRINQIRRDRPLTHEELMSHVPSVFGSDKHESRSDRYTYIPTITILESLHRAGQLTGHQVPEIILLNSHDGSSSYQMLPGLFRGVCTNGLVCGQSFGEVRVPHKGNVVEKVIEGAYEVLGVFDRVEEKRDAMQSLALPAPARHALANAALEYRFGEDHQPVTVSQLLTPRRREDYSDDLWTVYQRVQENLMKGGLSGRTAQGKSSRTRAVTGIDGDVKLNRALWVMAENMLEFFGR
ncbi:hypothetical protein BX14_12000 [Escherichia coli O45:H2 str. 2009C-3686]|uniref:DUF932 domain-containing protein n=1 Tax=Escherichia coli TaxID=562 RepID=UPI0004526E41|nr:DUF932 domain-containing protein [Escherichia coli]EFK1544095.1 DUF945 domain-containing protein [Escherichia coli]EZE22348.1 hypothetical protein BX14_12000 [Escherichia coli O45:H2 str. 2009C-3686]